METVEFNIPSLGFMNTGSICYFNSLIQSLLSCKSFIMHICEDKKESIFFLFFKLIAVEKNWDPFFTTKLLQDMKCFEPNQSSSEYFLKVCEYLKLDDLFKTTTETTTVCSECNHQTIVKDISVYIVIDNDMSEFCETKREIEGFNCDQCKRKVNATITSRLKETSSILTFSFNKYFHKKNISYPKGFIVDGKEYHITSTIEHMGCLNAGHYFCRSIRNSEFVKLDDNSVQKLDNIDSTENTYMVFYQQK